MFYFSFRMFLHQLPVVLDVSGDARLQLVAGRDVSVDLDEAEVGEEVFALGRVAVVVQDRLDLGTVVMTSA